MSAVINLNYGLENGLRERTSLSTRSSAAKRVIPKFICKLPVILVSGQCNDHAALLRFQFCQKTLRLLRSTYKKKIVRNSYTTPRSSTLVWDRPSRLLVGQIDQLPRSFRAEILYRLLENLQFRLQKNGRIIALLRFET